MGGDHGLPVTVPAAVQVAAKFPDTCFLLVGLPDQVEAALKQARPANPAQFEIVAASEVVTMEDPVDIALRKKKDSSMRVAVTCVKDDRADACVSAGNTGAWMAISRYVLKTMEGIDRPAIAAAIPNQRGGTTTVLDLGANVDCSAEHLLEFAIMGAALSQSVEHIENPSIGLLNIGQEAIKGNDVVKEAAELLRASNLNFYGNVEGDDIFKGTTNVVVCDGFVGNVVLKSVEGLSKMIGSMIRDEFMRNPFTMAAGLFARPVLNRFRKRVDSRNHNGAALLGLRGVVIKSHGSADIYAYTVALERARAAVASKLLEKTSSSVLQISQLIRSKNTESSA